MRMQVEIEIYPLKRPFRIAGHIWETFECVVVRLSSEGKVGWGEAAGVFYTGDTPTRIAEQIDSVRPHIEAGLDRELLQLRLPPGGARNAVDCALWDLESKLIGTPVWQLIGAAQPRPLVTALTLSAEAPDIVGKNACELADAKVLKAKLLGDGLDGQRVLAVRRARPDVMLMVDANQAFDSRKLTDLLPILLDVGVTLIEQPFPRGQDNLLDDFDCSIPFAADESCQSVKDLAQCERYEIINIKLDKCGGLTEALAMLERIKHIGKSAMVGNMIGTSLGMAPAYLIGQHCEFVDLDGALVLKQDRKPSMEYLGGNIREGQSRWGYPS